MRLAPILLAASALLAGPAGAGTSDTLRARTIEIFDAPRSGAGAASSICALADPVKSDPHITLEGAPFWDPDGHQMLLDDRCPDRVLFYDLGDDVQPGNHLDVLRGAMRDAHRGRYGHRVLECIVSGRLEISDGLPVLRIESVQRIWAARPEHR